MVTAHAIKSAEKMGLTASEVVGIQEEMQRKLQVALHELVRECLGNGK